LGTKEEAEDRRSLKIQLLQEHKEDLCYLPQIHVPANKQHI
jgi:hypothetical protein